MPMTCHWSGEPSGLRVGWKGLFAKRTQGLCCFTLLHRDRCVAVAGKVTAAGRFSCLRRAVALMSGAAGADVHGAPLSRLVEGTLGAASRLAVRARCSSSAQKKLPIVNSNTLLSSYGSGASGKPHSKRSGPSGENQRMPKPVLVRR